MDRTSKMILVAIAFGLWANVAVQVLRAPPATAQSADLNTMIHDIHAIYYGDCLNRIICKPY